MKKLLVFTTVIILTACSTKLAIVTQADADRASQKQPGITLASLNEGKTLYTQNCGKCHGLKAPTSRSEEQWKNVVPPMAKKAKINNREEELILNYVIAMGTAPKHAK